ncbi:hypothetical protein AB6D34_21315 [Pectobacterium brasiliense]|uniref:Uncharacterized protein n=2 Tax=Pectobacterium TaxID=122277 RepID=A0A3S1FDP4_9GAMM|nr:MULTISPECIES: hypothetical protein [Pectobacterium]KAA3669380.1 hypothetical protein FEV48_02560 [Pectobacterium carotovorum subsp. carotovorum]KFF65729.1 hypothetical protein IV99_05725 [Pectobacterium brasiliense]KHT23998.1 hypothetical protein RC96_00505 [Pectobacterium carotovorum subsp. carotovorum]KHT30622.1 hypothetical protein RD01_15280 [Pectobacterium carotovorum subsp. carotovorum]MBA0197259.1 hypothetical protein [Pectobacterium brasiliense]
MGIATCQIKELTLSARSVEAIEQINTLVDSANRLAFAVSTTPLYSIFSDPRSAKDVTYNVSDYDWELYGQAMAGIPNILRHKLDQVVEPMAWSSVGGESEFWKCVYASYNK